MSIYPNPNHYVNDRNSVPTCIDNLSILNWPFFRYETFVFSIVTRWVLDYLSNYHTWRKRTLPIYPCFLNKKLLQVLFNAPHQDLSHWALFIVFKSACSPQKQLNKNKSGFLYRLGGSTSLFCCGLKPSSSH